MSEKICKSTWIFIKIVHEQTFDMLDVDGVVRPLEAMITPIVETILDNHNIDFTKIKISSNLINQKEEDCNE